MTPEENRLLADLYSRFAIETAQQAAKLGLRHIPDGVLSAACGLSNTPDNRDTQWLIRGVVQDRIELELDAITNPATNAAEAKAYAKRDADLHNQLSNLIFMTEGERPDPNMMQMQMQMYWYQRAADYAKEGAVAQGHDIAPDSLPVPSFSDVCTANKAGRRL